MPQSKPKPSEIAAEAKRTYIPYIERRMPESPARSFLHADSRSMPIDPTSTTRERLRVAVIDGDPVDVALDWFLYNHTNCPRSQAMTRIPVVNMANERRAGGDWESGLMAPEECFARRSNLVPTLVTPWNPHPSGTNVHYPIPQRGGIYSPSVVVFRDGAEQYELWREFKTLPVISVAPVRRPKLDETGSKYSFEQEKDLMMDKMRTVLRIAATWRHRDICLGAFGIGPMFKNPVKEVAVMWKMLLFQDKEFAGAFSNVVFAIEKTAQPGGTKGGTSAHEVFQQIFNPATIFQTTYK